MHEYAHQRAWPEKPKVLKFGDNLADVVKKHFSLNLSRWRRQQGNAATLAAVMTKMSETFDTTVSEDEVTRLFKEKKRHGRTWKEHMVYLQYLYPDQPQQ